VATLAQQSTTVKPRGGRTAGQAGCIAPRVWSNCERLFYFLRCDHKASPPSVPKAPAITLRTHAESLPLSLLVPTYVIGPQRVGTRSPLVKPLQSQATARPATRAGWPGWIVAGVTSGLRITFFAAEPELPRTRLSLWQSVDEDAPIAGDVEMSRGYEDRGKMA
jgi:hypothetical protein